MTLIDLYLVSGILAFWVFIAAMVALIIIAFKAAENIKMAADKVKEAGLRMEIIKSGLKANAFGILSVFIRNLIRR
jgi:hypothetical protein